MVDLTTLKQEVLVVADNGITRRMPTLFRLYGYPEISASIDESFGKVTLHVMLEVGVTASADFWFAGSNQENMRVVYCGSFGRSRSEKFAVNTAKVWEFVRDALFWAVKGLNPKTTVGKDRQKKILDLTR